MSCGITEEEIKEQIALKDQLKKLDPTKCKRCDADPYVILQKKDVFCRLCFKQYFEHKFRSTIGKAKLIRPHHKVLIAYSGGQNSTAMLNLTMHCLNLENPSTRLLLRPYLLYIDETSILNCDLKSKEYNDKIDSILINYNIDKFYSKLEMYFSDSTFYSKEQIKKPSNSKQIKEDLDQTLNSFKSLTAKEEFIRRIRTNLIYRIAKAEQMDFVFIGTNGTRLAVQLLTDVAQGKGNQVNSEICFIDDRDLSIKLLKPMREFMSKEVAFWNRLNDSPFVEIEDLMTKKSAKSSIAKITEQFINYLQKDYPATTYTISKIGNKLQDQTDLKRQSCLLCQSPVEEMNEKDLSAQMALIITNSFGLKEASPTFNSSYCYGCNILLRETNKPDHFIDQTKKHTEASKDSNF